MSTTSLGKNLQDRIVSTLKINPQMSYLEAVETVLVSVGILNSRGSLHPGSNRDSYHRRD